MEKTFVTKKNNKTGVGGGGRVNHAPTPKPTTRPPTQINRSARPRLDAERNK